MINWSSVKKEDTDLIDEIVNRAIQKFKKNGNHVDQLNLTMDITAAHISNPLRLEELLKADEFNFFHDVCGIMTHIDRKTGELKDCFLPRFSRPEKTKIMSRVQITKRLATLSKIDQTIVTDEKGNLDVQKFNQLPKVKKLTDDLKAAGITKDKLGAMGFVPASLVLQY